jgi:hypothetical protein
MKATTFDCETLLERLAGELTDAAYPVVLGHGAGRPSVEVEVEVGEAIRRVLGNGWRRARAVAADAAVPPSRTEVVAEVADAVYQVALRHGFREPFPDMELGLWKALERTGGGEKYAAALGCLRAGRR